MKLEKLYQKGYDNHEKLMNYSKWIVKTHVIPDPRNSHLTAERLERITESLSVDMSIGSEFTKNKYIITGMAIGVVSVLMLAGINKLYRDRA